MQSNKLSSDSAQINGAVSAVLIYQNSQVEQKLAEAQAAERNARKDAADLEAAVQHLAKKVTSSEAKIENLDKLSKCVPTALCCSPACLLLPLILCHATEWTGSLLSIARAGAADHKTLVPSHMLLDAPMHGCGHITMDCSLLAACTITTDGPAPCTTTLASLTGPPV